MTFEIRRLRRGTVTVRRLDLERLRIGRGTNADLAFDDAAVDLEHAVIERDGTAWALTDRDSVSGTWVNGRRIETVRLAEGDLVEIGDHRIRVAGLGEVPVLEILVAETRTEPEVPSSPPVDFAAAHRLRHGWLSKSALSLAGVLLALTAVLALGVSGRTTAFRPGPVSEAHARSIGARACWECHQPWRGPADALCVECHAEHPVHQPTQASTPPCGSCHTEHRRLAQLQQVPDAACVSCHRDLELKDGAQPRFASRVTDFGTDHPEFALDVAGLAGGADGGERRLPLTDPTARRSDPATLKLNHQLHLKPGLLGPEGRVTLVCTDCHEAPGPAGATNGASAAGGGHLRPVEFERHCQRCHELGFDVAGRARERAPHAEPSQVRGYLLAVFLQDPELDALTLEERRRWIIENPTGSRRRQPSPALIAQVNQAERFLYQTRCSVCHAVDLTTSPPTVAPPGVPTDWLPDARFPHERHGESLGLECTYCHEGAETSTATADVLLPGIEICRECHGQGEASALTESGDESRRVPSACVDCHSYHGG